MFYRVALIIPLLSAAFFDAHVVSENLGLDLYASDLNRLILEDTRADPCVEGCFNCKLAKTCLNGYPQFTNCIPTQVCEDATCYDKVQASSCSCIGEPDGPYRDPYNPRFYYVCLMGEENYYGCPSNQIFALSKQTCIDVPDCTTLGCFSLVEDCQTYYCCQKNLANFTQEIFTCNDGSIFNEDTNACESVTPACTTSGIIGDPHKCDLYHSCSGPNDQNPTNLCCPSGQKYDTSTFNCVVDEGTCGNVNICYDSYFETNFCNRCTSITDRFPFMNLCSIYYYGCEASGTDFIQVLKECPTGYVYNPEGNVCDFPANVGC